MSAEDYKLSYFNIRGLAEPIRLLLVDNEIAFNDNTFTGEQWPTIKSTMPFGQAPCLFQNGIPLAQSGAILRHLARKHGLYGADLNQAAFIDMFYEGVLDARKKYQDFIYRDVETKESFLNNVKAELEKLEKLGTKHSAFTTLKSGGYIAGEKISYADYVFFEFLDTLVTLDSKVLEPFAVLKDYYKTMSGRPKLSIYLKSEKRTSMKINGNGKQ